jgi:CheY-like chemotaxis protein
LPGPDDRSRDVPPRGRPQGRHILVVDDNPGVIAVFSEALRTAGYSVQAAMNGHEALALFTAHRPAVVLLDLRMPGKGGVRVFAELRQIDARVPIIIVSGDGDEHRARALLQEGAFDYVPKPVDLSHLGVIVAAAIRQSSQVDLAAEEAKRGGVDLAGVRVLVVDDTPDGLDLISAVLEQCGATVVAAPSADEAIRLVHRERIDVVVSDIAMPGHDGYWLVQRLRHDDDAQTRKVVAIAVSGVVRDERSRVLAAGFDDFFQKPIEAIALCHRVSELVAS